MMLEARIEIVHAYNCICNCKEDKEDRNHRKGRQRLSDGLVQRRRPGLVDAHEFEDEVGEGDEIAKNDEQHAVLVLLAREEGGRQKDDNRDGNDGNGEAKLEVFGLVVDHDEELDHEAEEEEEVELEESNVNLQKSNVRKFRLWKQISSNVKNVPGSGGSAFSSCSQPLCASGYPTRTPGTASTRRTPWPACKPR